MEPNDTTPPATDTFRVWADHVRRVFQDVEASGPKQAHESARDQPECWEDCFEHEDRDDFQLSDEVQDLATEKYHHVGRGGSNAGDRYPGVPFERAALRVVLSGGRDFDDEGERQAAQHFALMAMHPDDVDETGGGPGGIIADLGQFPEAERYADLFAASFTLLRAVEAARSAFAERTGALTAERQDVLRGGGREEDCEDIDDRIAIYRHLAGWCDDALREVTGREKPVLRLAADRHDARLRDRFARYPALHAEERIRLALMILNDVSGGWDHDTLEHYPDGLGSFDEFLTELGMKLCEIRWSRPGRPPADGHGAAA